VPVNLSTNHSLPQLRQTGDDLTKTFAKKAHLLHKMYLTISINAFLKISTQKYIFLNLHIYFKEMHVKQAILTREIVSLLLRSVQAESGHMQQFGPPGSL
jgi:hypothetical protein